MARARAAAALLVAALLGACNDEQTSEKPSVSMLHSADRSACVAYVAALPSRRPRMPRLSEAAKWGSP